MVRLKKIKMTDDYIEAYYVPEDTSEEGYIKIDVNTCEDIDVRLTLSDKVLKWYYTYARMYLTDVIKGKKKLQEEKSIMWY